jgi:hypothetical protein
VTNSDILGKNRLEKHTKYESQYGKNELYWGIGIENETYLEFSKKLKVSKDFFLQNHRPERYSVNYYEAYKKEILEDIFSIYYTNFLSGKGIHKNEKDIIELPLIINSHVFDQTDRFGEPCTIYKKGSPSNPKFCGQTLDEYFRETIPYFSREYGKSFTYDGDTVEFITEKFYKTNVTSCIDELMDVKEKFLEHIETKFPYKEYGYVRFMTKNHPFAINFTNRNNVSMFNNGTYHFNFTLPSQLDENGKIKDEEKFVNDHRRAIRVLQLFSPLFLCIFGSPDPFSKVNDTFSAASQRCSVSRYISIGTYDTEKMKKGKILTVPVEELEVSKIPYWWFNQFHSHSSYSQLKSIGVDINFNKHYLHGIEFRIFDYFAEEELDDLLKFIVYLFDVALEKEDIPNYVMTEEWNNMTAKCMRYGNDATLSTSEMYLFEKLFEKQIFSSTVGSVYNEIYSILLNRYSKNKGNASKYMLNIDSLSSKLSCCNLF